LYIGVSALLKSIIIFQEPIKINCMKKYVFLLVVIIGLSAFCPPAGVLRWDNKILIDPDGLKLFNAHTSPSSVDELVKLIRPEKNELGKNRAELEKQKVTLTCFIMEDGKEADGDYHLVLKSTSTGKTLIAEIPDPETPKLKGFPGLRSKYSKARNFVLENVDATPGEIQPSPHGKVKVIITGIVFFDKPAHGHGHSDNGVEIHPILDIKLAH
jgi:hypothetical protein